MDTVILSTLIELIMLLPLGHNTDPIHFFTNVGNLMTNLLVATLSGIVGLLILNYVIKGSAAYQWVVSSIGCIISLLSVASIPLLLISLLGNERVAGAGIIGALILFSRSTFPGMLRSAFLKAIVCFGDMDA